MMTTFEADEKKGEWFQSLVLLTPLRCKYKGLDYLSSVLH